MHDFLVLFYMFLQYIEYMVQDLIRYIQHYINSLLLILLMCS